MAKGLLFGAPFALYRFLLISMEVVFMENASFLYSLYQKIAAANETNETIPNSETLLEDVYSAIRANSSKIQNNLEELKELNGKI